MGSSHNLYLNNSVNYSDLNMLFDAYYDRLVFFSWQIVKDKQQAEDTTQDAFITYWRQRDHIANHPIAIKNFLYRTVKNASLDIVRHIQVVSQFQTRQLNVEQCESHILEAIISAEIIAEVHEAIDALPAHLKEISKLCFLEGKKNQEAADELGISVNTLKKQKQRTIELLRIRLNQDLIILLITCGAYFARN